MASYSYRTCEICEGVASDVETKPCHISIRVQVENKNDRYEDKEYKYKLCNNCGHEIKNIINKYYKQLIKLKS